MTKGVVVRAIMLALMVLAASAFVIDWNVLVGPFGRRYSADATLQGNPILLATRAAGNLIAVPVADYASVHAGDLLFAIDDADYRARIDSAAAALQAAEAGIREAEAEVALQTAELGVSSAAIGSAEADLERARRERVRQDALKGTESYLQSAWQGAVAAEQRQSAGVEGRRRALAAAEAQIEVLQAQLDSRRAARDAASDALTLAKVQLGYTRITAPVDGVVTARLARVGEYVMPGRALITLLPQNDIWAVVNYREVQLEDMRPGQPARVKVDALPGIVLKGHVDSIAPVSEASGSRLPPDRATGNFTKIIQRVPVKIALDPEPRLAGLLRPGLSVEVAVFTADPP